MDKRVFSCGSRKNVPIGDTDKAVPGLVPSLIDPAYFGNSQIVVASVGYSHAIAVTSQGRVRKHFSNTDEIGHMDWDAAQETVGWDMT